MKDNQDIFQNSLDYKKLLQKFLNYKKVYIGLILLFLILAYLINKLSDVVYNNYTTLYLNEENKSSAMNSANDMFQSFGLFNVESNIENELEIIKSFSLLKKVIVESDLKVSYYSYKHSTLADLFSNSPFARDIELYNQTPIKVIFDNSVPQAVNLKFYITFLNETEFLIETDGEQIPLYNYIDDQVVSYIPAIHFKQRFKFGDDIKTKYFNFLIQKSNNFYKDYTNTNRLFFVMNDINNLALQYQNALKTETTSERSTLIKITLTGTNRQRISDFLNNLAGTYLGKSLEKKNKTALSTIDFIDTQISEVVDSLNFAESTLKNFRSSQGVMDLNFQGQQIFEQLGQLENDRATLQIQKKYYEYLNNYLNTNTEVNDLMGPSAMNVVDPILTSLVTQLIALNNERASILKNSANQQNLYLADINIRIDNLKKTIKETVRNTLNTLNISLNEINYRMDRASGQISQMPKTELQLRGIERKFKLSDAIYTFLLQKRSEAQIARASSLPDYEIVDAAIPAMSKMIAPKKMLNFLMAIILGFLIPSVFILVKDILNNKLSDSDEIEKLTSYPVIGRIYHNYHRSKLVVNDHPHSSVTESFRAVNANFQFFSEGGKRQVILFTSSTSGEGKTFSSINLATVFALNGNRTILLEFDLRRPKIHQEFGSSNLIGISSFLIDKAIIEDIITPTQIQNLDLISAGPAAPNPAELIGTERTGELIDKLKEMYDYVIIDSAPAGILTETMLLMKHSDFNIFVARLNSTIKEAFRNTIISLEAKKFNNISILINDLNIKRESYRYAYDNKYYTDDNTGFFYKLLHRKKVS